MWGVVISWSEFPGPERRAGESRRKILLKRRKTQQGGGGEGKGDPQRRNGRRPEKAGSLAEKKEKGRKRSVDPQRAPTPFLNIKWGGGGGGGGPKNLSVSKGASWGVCGGFCFWGGFCFLACGGRENYLLSFSKSPKGMSRLSMGVLSTRAGTGRPFRYGFLDIRNDLRHSQHQNLLPRASYREQKKGWGF